MAQLVVGRDDGAVAGGIELRPSGSAENLEKKWNFKEWKKHSRVPNIV